MIIIPHMLVGAAIGVRTRNIWLVFILGWLSHYLLDFFPHWDYLSKIEITSPTHLIKIGLDFILGAFLVFILTRFYPKKRLVLIGVIAVLLPDFLNVIYYAFNIQWLESLVWFHHTAHHWQGLSFWQGLPATLVVSLLAVFVLIISARSRDNIDFMKK